MDKLIESRKLAASKQDYDLKFEQLCHKIALTINRKNNPTTTHNNPLNILVLYDGNSVYVSTTHDHLQSFTQYSKHKIFYANAVGHSHANIDLSVFDVVVIHYSVRVNLQHIASAYLKALKNYTGYKILFLQDEYETTNVAKKKILELGIHTVFSNVSAQYLEKVYPDADFHKVNFIHNLTGYIPEHLTTNFKVKPAQERPLWLGYRGRDLPYWYGNLGREKDLIGREMKKICQARGVPADIESDTNKRIYGAHWFEFLANCRATLGTESGSNVFDFDGNISLSIKEVLKKKPYLSYEEIFEQYLKEHEGNIMMNQISPKIFEAIALRTALILFEGTYSNVVQPDVHFIPLKKDFSNIDTVLAKLADVDYINQMTERSYHDIVQSGAYSYRHFINNIFDAHLENTVKKRNDYQLIPVVYVRKRSEQGTGQKATLPHIMGSAVSNELLPDPQSLLLINTIDNGLAKNFKARKTITYMITRLINRIRLNQVLFNRLLRVNNSLPSRPLSKIYYLIQKFL